jgi:hypothetical protein
VSAFGVRRSAFGVKSPPQASATRNPQLKT